MSDSALLWLFLHLPHLPLVLKCKLVNSVLVRDYILYKTLQSPLSLAHSMCSINCYSIKLGSKWLMLTATPARTGCSGAFPVFFHSMFCVRVEQWRGLTQSLSNEKCIYVAREFPIRAGGKRHYLSRTRCLPGHAGLFAFGTSVLHGATSDLSCVLPSRCLLSVTFMSGICLVNLSSCFWALERGDNFTGWQHYVHKFSSEYSGQSYSARQTTWLMS